MLPPGPPESPLRQALSWVREPTPFLERNRDRFGDRFTVRFGRFPPTVLLSDPEDIREVLATDPDLLRSGAANESLSTTLGPRSLLVLDGAEHLRERRLLLPPFHGERMRAYRALIEEATRTSLEAWPRGAPFPTAPRMRALTLEVILRAVFGVRERERADRLGRALVRMLDVVTTKPRLLILLLANPGEGSLRAWYRFSPAMRSLNSLIAEQVAHGRRRLEAEGAGDDILSLLLEARDEDGAPLSDSHLRDELVTLVAAGHETTATALAWTLEQLVRDPGSLERLGADGAEGDALADSVATETLRLRPPVPFVVRQLARDATVAGMELPAGVRVAPCGYLVHRRPDLYPDADRFVPDRFLSGPPKGPGWLPFGGGTRRCIGAAFAGYEMRTVLRTVARSGRLSPPPTGREGWGRRGLILTPERGGTVVWEPAAASP